ncbi:LysR family transcriptional regulator [Pseudomonas luteola]|uniref:LysR substrate-binding domain-containing protein n=1 Tax=Pseudomonas luteola TaxID=47886 RepID=UPI000F7972C7|nr:LysR substrate-binding domain-containing protein [Pseudomonas luteola]RRW39622.1 LysR family transcriptional regulator [Pseudomonas luteola]
MRHIDPISLRLFIAVCEEGTIARASEREFIAPSAVSKRIADIESDLGISMLQRSKRGVTPTPAGQALLKHARQLMRSMERLQSELGEYAEGARGHVKIFANISSIMEFLPEELSAFMLAHENIQVDIEEHFSPDVVRGVLEGQADLGICRKSMATGALEFFPYRRDHLALIVNAHHPLANRSTITLRETLDYDHIGLSAFATVTSFIQTIARESGQELKFRAHVSTFDAAYRLVQVGLAQTILPREAASRYTELFGLRLVPLTDTWAQGEFVICVRDAEALSPSARRLLNHLLASAH